MQFSVDPVMSNNKRSDQSPLLPTTHLTCGLPTETEGLQEDKVLQAHVFYMDTSQSQRK